MVRCGLGGRRRGRLAAWSDAAARQRVAQQKFDLSVDAAKLALRQALERGPQRRVETQQESLFFSHAGVRGGGARTQSAWRKRTYSAIVHATIAASSARSTATNTAPGSCGGAEVWASSMT